MVSYIYFEDHVSVLKSDKIYHNLPRVLQLYFGVDGVFPNFNGVAHYFKLIVGPGSYVFSPKEFG
jgi:hypothetical protein